MLFDSPYQFCAVHACLLTCWQGRRVQQHRKGTSRQPWWFAVCRTGGTYQTAQGHHIWTLSRGLHPVLWLAARKRSLEDKRETWHQYSQSCYSEAQICCLWGKQKHGVSVSKAAVGDIICIQCLWGHWKQSVNVSKAAVGERNTGPVRRIKTKCQCFWSCGGRQEHWACEANKTSVSISKAAVGERNTVPVMQIKTKCQCF